MRPKTLKETIDELAKQAAVLQKIAEDGKLRDEVIEHLHQAHVNLSRAYSKMGSGR